MGRQGTTTDAVTHLEVGEVDLCAGGDHIGRVDTLEADAVDLVRAGDEEKARLGELLEADNSAALLGAGKEDEDGARLDGFSQAGGLGGRLSGLLGDSDIVGVVEARSLLDENGSLLAVGVAADRLLGGSGQVFSSGIRLGLGGRLVGALVVGLLLGQSVLAQATEVVRLAEHWVSSNARHLEDFWSAAVGIVK